MKRITLRSFLAALAVGTLLPSQACGGKTVPGSESAGGGSSSTTSSGGSGAGTTGNGVGGSSTGVGGNGTGGSGVGGNGTGGSGGTGVGGSGGSGNGTGGNGAGGTSGGGTGGSGGGPGTCPATCGAPAGTVRTFASIDEVYAALVGLWQICPTLGKPFDAPTDAIGIEYAPQGANGIRNLYYLVRGASGPVRGAGFAYQQTYDVSPFPGGGFQLNTHPSDTTARPYTFRYSPCPEEFQITISAMMGLLVRFP